MPQTSKKPQRTPKLCPLVPRFITMLLLPKFCSVCTMNLKYDQVCLAFLMFIMNIVTLSVVFQVCSIVRGPHHDSDHDSAKHLARAAQRLAGKPARLCALAVFLGAHNGFALLFVLSAPLRCKEARFGVRHCLAEPRRRSPPGSGGEGGGVWNVSAARARRKLGKAQVSARANGF